MPVRLRFHVASIFPSCFCWVFPEDEPTDEGFIPGRAPADARIGATPFNVECELPFGATPVCMSSLDWTLDAPAFCVSLVGCFPAVRPCMTVFGFRFTGFEVPLPVLATVTFRVGECEPVDFL